MTIIKPGTVVKDKEGRENHGLQMKVIDEEQNRAMVAYLNLDGLYRESWLQKDRLLPVSKEEENLLPLNPGLY